MSTRTSSRRGAPAASATTSMSPSLSSRNANDLSLDAADGHSAPRRRGRPRKDVSSSRQEQATTIETNPPRNAPMQNKKARKSSGVTSAISGTTARTSLSDQELAQLDSESLIDGLPDLNAFSGRILDQLAPRDISMTTVAKLAGDIKDQNNRTGKNFNKASIEFNRVKQHYGDGRLINISLALRGMLGVRTFDEVSTGLWRPDEILQKANLAATIEEIYIQLGADSSDLPLEKLDRDFPEPFTSRLVNGVGTPGASALFRDTFEIGLEIRTQFALQVLKAQSDEANFDPYQVVTQIFYLPDDDPSPRGWDVDGLRSRSLKPNQRKVIGTRISDIQNKIEKKGVDFNGLNEAFPFMSFLVKYIHWVRARVQELDTRIDNAGKAEAIQEAIEAEIKRRQQVGSRPELAGDTIQVNFQPPPGIESSGLSGQNSTDSGGSSMQRFKQMKRQHQNQQQDQQQISTSSRAPINQAPTAPMFGSSTDFPIDPQLMEAGPTDGHISIEQQLRQNQQEQSAKLQAAARAAAAVPLPTSHAQNSPSMLQGMVAKHHRDAAEANKENDPQASTASTAFRAPPSLLDPQPNATRLAWDTQQPEEINGSLAMVRSSGHEASDDDAFEQDQRPPPPQNRRKRAAPRQRNGTTAKRQRFQEIDPSSSIAPISTPYPPTIPNDISQYPNIEKYYEAKEANKINTATKVKQPQKRRPWSVEETNFLQECIETIGTSWAAIKKHDEARDNIFVHRDQVALKDKARNMKFDFIKARATLPTNFDLIPLKSSQKTDLLAHDIDVRYLEQHNASVIQNDAG